MENEKKTNKERGGRLYFNYSREKNKNLQGQGASQSSKI